jgi:hypothetical protein
MVADTEPRQFGSIIPRPSIRRTGHVGGLVLSGAKGEDMRMNSPGDQPANSPAGWQSFGWIARHPNHAMGWA